MPGIDEKPNEWRVRQKQPTGYDHYTRKNIAPGVDLLLGWKNDKSEVQALRFNKDHYKTRDEVTAWVKAHPDYHMDEGVDDGDTDMAEQARLRMLTPRDLTLAEGKRFFTDAIITLADTDQEGGEFSFIEILREGTWKHPVYGPLKVTAEALQEMKRNFDNGVRRIFDDQGKPTLDIDYDHKKGPEGGRASGWIKALKVAETTLKNGKKLLSLWAQPKWTPDAQAAIKNGEYKYFSAEFQEEYKDAEQNKTFKNVLLGGGITNRPFVKELAPLTLTEPEENTAHTNKEETKMLDSLKEVLKKAGVQLAEDVNEADAIKALGEKFKADADFADSLNKQLSEQMTKLAETEKKLAEVEAERAAAKKEADEKRKAVILAEANTKMSPADQKEILEPLFAEGKFELAEKIVGKMPIAEALKGAKGKDGEPDEDDEDEMETPEAVDKAVTKYMEKNKMAATQYGEALAAVKKEYGQKQLEKKFKENAEKK